LSGKHDDTLSVSLRKEGMSIPATVENVYEIWICEKPATVPQVVLRVGVILAVGKLMPQPPATLRT